MFFIILFLFLTLFKVIVHFVPMLEMQAAFLYIDAFEVLRAMHCGLAQTC